DCAELDVATARSEGATGHTRGRHDSNLLRRHELAGSADLRPLAPERARACTHRPVADDQGPDAIPVVDADERQRGRGCLQQLQGNGLSASDIDSSLPTTA